MAPHSSTLAWKIPWMEEPGRLPSMGSLRVRYDWETSLSLFTFMHWRRKCQPTQVFLPGESQGRWSLLSCHLWGCNESDTTEWLNWTELSSLRYIPFLSFIKPIFAWNVPLITVIFLKRSLVFPILLFSSVYLHWLLRKAFLSLLAILWNSVFRCLYLSFSPFSFHFSSFHSYL